MFVAVASLALISCGGDEKDGDWTKEQKDKFLDSCIGRAGANSEINAEEYCGCMLDKVIEKYPDPKDVNKVDEKWMQEEAAKCLGM